MSTLVIKNDVKDHERPIYNVITLTSSINEEKVASVIDNIIKAKPGAFVIHMSTNGGDVNVGFGISTMLEVMAHPVTFISRAMNASMGAVLPHTLDSLRLCYDTSVFLYHASSARLTGAYETIEHKLDFYKERERDLDKKAYTAIGITKKQYEKYSKADVMINAQQALTIGTHGMVDGIIIKDYQDGRYLIKTRDGNKEIDVTKHRRSDLKTLPVIKG